MSAMSMEKTVLVFLIHGLVWLLQTSLIFCVQGDDVDCLKGIKDSLKDPNNYLTRSWDLRTRTEDHICEFTGVECWNSGENRVKNIQLSGMGLEGRFPRGIKKCRSLTGLDLSKNKLSGPIPSDICERLPWLTSLDLSSNSFSGEIPSSLANCTYLNTLILNKNQLTGQIPEQLTQLARRKAFDVANISLSEQIPASVSAKFPPESYEGNQGLCGFPLSPCEESSWISRASFVSGFVVGWVITTVVVLLATLLFFFDRLPPKKFQSLKIKSRGSKSKPEENKNKQMQGRTLQSLGGSKNSKISMFEKLATHMSLKDLQKATENFSEDNLIGWGRMGAMYKARLTNGWCLAIKRFQDSQHSEKQFTKELTILGRMRHVNLVPLLGFCIDMEEKLLVYKYMCNGSLHDWLHPLDGKASTLNWPSRIRIGIGLARALAWLHHNCSNPIIHRDINSKCILLDRNFEPKISNFSGAMSKESNGEHSSIRPTVKGKFYNRGYVAPECTPIMTTKWDVYSFGIVLLELVTGEEPTQVSIASESFNGNLVEWINHVSNTSSGLYDAVDKSLLGKGYDDEIFQLLRVACNCVQCTPNHRPTMIEVYNNLKALEDKYGLSPEIPFQTEIVSA